MEVTLPRGSGPLRALALPVAVLTLLMSGCGDDSEGSDATLAGLAPAETSAYFEATVLPEGEEEEAIEAISSRFPDGTDLGQQIVEAIDASLAEESSPDDPSTYAADIQPWLGPRLAAFLTDVGGDPETGEDASATLIIETTDADEASEAIERLSANSTETETETEVDGVQLLVDENGEAVGVVGDHVVAGPQASVEQVIAVDSGDEDDLAGRDDFTFDAGEADGASALGFSWVDTEAVIEQSIDPNTAAGFGEGQLNELIAQAGFDTTAPATFVLTATDDSVVLDSSIGITDDYEMGSGEPLANLPSDAFLAADATVYLKAFRVGFDYGVAQSAAEDGVSPEDAQQAIKSAYGLTASELEEALGDAAFYLTGTPGTGPSGAAVIEVSDPAPVSEALRVIPKVIALAGAADVGPLPPTLPDGLEGLSLTTAEIPQPLTIASDDELLVVALGDEAAAEVLDPSETLADSGDLGGAEGLEGFETNAVFDLDAALPVLEAVSAGDPDFVSALPYLEVITGATSGSRVDGDRLITRTVVDFG